MISTKQKPTDGTDQGFLKVHRHIKKLMMFLPNVINVVTNIQAMAIPTFRISSPPTIASVSQLMYVRAIAKLSLDQGISDTILWVSLIAGIQTDDESNLKFVF